MIQSMTGFAEKRFQSRTISARVSIKSLNHRFFDWNFSGTQVGAVESKLRVVCQKKVRRGRVEVFFDLRFLDTSRWDISVNQELFGKLLSALKKASSTLKKEVHFSVENLLEVPHVVRIERKDFSKDEVAFLEKSFENTLEEMLKQRRREGRALAGAIRAHVQNIRRSLGTIERLAKKQPQRMKTKLELRLKELAGEAVLSEERLIEEAAYSAQKYDLTEEIARMKSHLIRIQELLMPKNREPVGRNLDFMTQEMYREINTIGSKSQDMDIISESLKVKAEVESVRQQAQNIE